MSLVPPTLPTFPAASAPSPATLSAQLFSRLLGLLRRPAVIVAAVCLAGCAGLVALPLMDVPGYELSLAMAAAISLFGGIVGAAAARQERQLLIGMDPRPKGAIRTETAFGAAAFAFLAATAFNLALLLPALLASLLAAALSTRCSPFAGLGFYAVMPTASAVLAAAVGAFCGFLSRRAWASTLFYVLAILLSAAVTVWPLYFGPQVFAFNAFAGYFPGPLYDEALEVTDALLTHQELVLALALLVLGLSSLSLKLKTGCLGLPHLLRPGSLALCAGAGALLLLGARAAFALGLYTSPGQLEKALGGRRETAHFVLHFPKEKTKEEINQLERGLEFDFARATAFLGVSPKEKIVAYVYRSPEEKRRLVGAAATDFAKPWRHEFHIHDASFPHPVARHEMVHAIAAEFGSGPLKVSSQYGFVINVGLIEGLAVAADNRPDELTLHEWARAMRGLGLAPDLRSIVGSTGFWGEAPSRAYALAGSFVLYLSETFGAERLRALYAHGDFQAAYDRPLDLLARDWEAFIDKIPLDEQAKHVAEVRFEQGSLFSRPCARELAELQKRAQSAFSSDPREAASLYRRCQEISPEDPGFLQAEANALREGGELTAALESLQQLLALPQLGSAAKAQALLLSGDILWEQGDLKTAAERFRQALALHRDRATDRTAAVKAEALSDAETSRAVRRYFKRAGAGAELLRLKELVDARPAYGAARYLLGRALQLQGDHRRADIYLSQALSMKLPDPEVEREGLRLLAQARFEAGDCVGARISLSALREKSKSEADKQWADEWEARCRFEEKTYGGALSTGD